MIQQSIKRNTIELQQPSTQKILHLLTQSANDLNPLSLQLTSFIYRYKKRLPMVLKNPQIISPTQIFKKQKQESESKSSQLNLYLDFVYQSYYKKNSDQYQQSRSFENIISPIKVNHPYQNWTPKQIATFEGALCTYGKQFEFISTLIGTKSSKQIFEFYLQWKTSNHYKQWKKHKNIANKNNGQGMI